MTRWLPILSALWVSSASAIIDNIFNGVTRELAAVKDPIDKTATAVVFSQCNNVKKIIGVAYENFDEEPDMSRVTLNFISPQVKIQFNLTGFEDILQSPFFEPKHGLVIYFHGFTDDPSKDSYTNINNAFSRRGIKNILALDASSLIRWLYLRSTTLVRFIGTKVGRVISLLVKAGLDPALIYLVGHSLGAHIASFAGKEVLALTGSRVGRITGLDPAGPCFAHMDPELRINKGDAIFVDIIHSDAGVYGMKGNLGHVDYFPNGGSAQPNCPLQTCSHSRAWELYAESVTNTTAFAARECTSWKDFKAAKCKGNKISYMGFGCEPGTVGQYYLQTAPRPPYALGAAGAGHDGHDAVVKQIFEAVGISRK